MTYVSCPNCAITLYAGVTADPPTICPECCARLWPTDISASKPVRAPFPVPPRAYDAVLAIGRDAPGAARHAFEEFAEPFGDDVSFTGSLLISELVTNAVMHGPLGADATVGLHFERAGNSVQVEVSDGGPGFMPRGRYEGQDRGSGWGLHLVEELAGSWGVEGDSPTRVWFELPLATPAPAL